LKCAFSVLGLDQVKEEKGNPNVTSKQKMELIELSSNKVNRTTTDSENNKRQSKDDLNSLEENVVHNVIHSLTTNSHPMGVLVPPPSIAARACRENRACSTKSSVRYAS
jgi:hypothetical protein